MTINIGIYDKEGTVHCVIKTVMTGEAKDCTVIHQQVAGHVEAAAYEAVRKLVTNNTIPEAIVIWGDQTIRVRHS